MRPAAICCPIRQSERRLCDELRARLALESDADLVRTALYHYAGFVLGAAAVDPELFRLPSPRRMRRADLHLRRRA